MTQEQRRGRLKGNIALLFAASTALFSCHKQVPVPESQPPPVTIAKPTQKGIIEWDYYTGRTDAVENVNITPRVSGYIENVTFRAGDIVNKGDLLFVIDPRPYQAVLDQAKAQQREAEANQQLQDANFARQDRLRQTGLRYGALEQESGSGKSSRRPGICRIGTIKLNFYAGHFPD
jgi:multidrug efflux pump subunit AcrA (membrane-fusion protein)